MPDDKVNEGESVVDEAKLLKDGKHPETITWQQYVGTKESLSKKLEAATAKVTNLEEQLKNAPNAEEHTRIKKELDDLKVTHQTVTTELNTIKEASLTEKRGVLLKRGIPEAEVKGMTAKELDITIRALGTVKTPLPDLGGGGGGSPLKGSPMELATLAYSKSK
jgi:hypothetical protein